MFMQVVQGRTSDPGGLRRQVDRWLDELASGATGYLGATGGVADDGTAILVARFASEQAARENNDRPEQGAWWADTEKYFDGDVTFRDCTEVEVTLGGGSDDAGFVQVTQGRALDRNRASEIEQRLLQHLSDVRPDILGMIRGWDRDFFTQVIYFTNEAEARTGEAAMSEQLGDVLAELDALAEGITFVDLRDPWLISP